MSNDGVPPSQQRWQKLRRVSPRAEATLRTFLLFLAARMPSIWRKLRWVLLRAAALLGAFLLLSVTVTTARTT